MHRVLNDTDSDGRDYLYMVTGSGLVGNYGSDGSGKPYYYHYVYGYRHDGRLQWHGHQYGYCEHSTDDQRWCRSNYMQRFVNNDDGYGRHYVYMVATDGAVGNYGRHGSGKPYHYDYLYGDGDERGMQWHGNQNGNSEYDKRNDNRSGERVCGCDDNTDRPYKRRGVEQQQYSSSYGGNIIGHRSWWGCRNRNYILYCRRRLCSHDNDGG